MALLPTREQLDIDDCHRVAVGDLRTRCDPVERRRDTRIEFRIRFRICVSGSALAPDGEARQRPSPVPRSERSGRVSSKASLTDGAGHLYVNSNTYSTAGIRMSSQKTVPALPGLKFFSSTI